MAVIDVVGVLIVNLAHWQAIVHGPWSLASRTLGFGGRHNTFCSLGCHALIRLVPPKGETRSSQLALPIPRPNVVPDVCELLLPPLLRFEQ